MYTEQLVFHLCSTGSCRLYWKFISKGELFFSVTTCFIWIVWYTLRFNELYRCKCKNHINWLEVWSGHLQERQQYQSYLSLSNKFVINFRLLIGRCCFTVCLYHQSGIFRYVLCIMEFKFILIIFKYDPWCIFSRQFSLLFLCCILKMQTFLGIPISQYEWLKN